MYLSPGFEIFREILSARIYADKNIRRYEYTLTRIYVGTNIRRHEYTSARIYADMTMMIADINRMMSEVNNKGGRCYVENEKESEGDGCIVAVGDTGF